MRAVLLRIVSALRCATVALALSAGAVPWAMIPKAMAEDAPAAGSQPPAASPDTPAAATQNSAPDAAAEPVCIDETGDYVTHGNAVNYVIGLTNKCDKRLKCKVYASVAGARGTVSGETTLILGKKSGGAAATKTYTMKVKSAGGIAQVSRECRAF